MTDTQSSGTSGATSDKTQPPMTGTQASGGAGSTTASDNMEPRKEAHSSEQHVTEQQQSGRKTDQSDQNTGQNAGQASGQHGNQVSGKRTDQQKPPQPQNSNEDEAEAQPS